MKISLEDALRLLGQAHEVTVEESGEPSFEKVLIPSPRDGVFLRLRGNRCGYQFRIEDNRAVEVEGTSMVLMDDWEHAVRLVLLVPMRF